MDKRQLYESIMKSVSKQVKKALNEGELVDVYDDPHAPQEIYTLGDLIKYLEDIAKIEGTDNIRITNNYRYEKGDNAPLTATNTGDCIIIG